MGVGNWEVPLRYLLSINCKLRKWKVALCYLSSVSCGRGYGRLLYDIYHQSAVGGIWEVDSDNYHQSAEGGGMGGCFMLSIISQVWEGVWEVDLRYLSSVSCGRGYGRLIYDIYHQSVVGGGMGG